MTRYQPYRRLIRREDGALDLRGPDNDSPNSLPLTAFPEVHALVQVAMSENEGGQYAFGGSPGFFAPGTRSEGSQGPWAVGRCSSLIETKNAVVNAKLARDPSLQSRISVSPAPDNTDPSAGDSPTSRPGAASRKTITSADALEALHQATRLPVVADYYTRLYDPAALSLRNQPLFEALNQLGDGMHLRWSREESTREPGVWLQFRSISFYDDRLKEVPNRLLVRWTASRRQHGFLTLEDLVEIAQLTDTQLDAADMAEGAREYWGLKEWDLVRSQPPAFIRRDLRALAAFTPEERQEMLSPAGLPFTRMSLPQQQQFIAFALEFDTAPLQSLDELVGAALRVSYTQPGWFEWRPPGPWWLRYVVPLERGKRVPLPPVRERTREGALRALRRIDPQIREAVLQAWHRSDPQAQTAVLDETAQIIPTQLELTIIYIPDSTNTRNIRVVWGSGGNSVIGTW